MYFYLVQYSVLCLLGLINPKRLSNKIYYFALFALLITIGLRYQVGGDWGTYLDNYRKLTLSGVGFSTFMIREPGWLIFSYISKLISPYEIFPLNLMCAAIFLMGIESICRDTKRKYLALAISYPILVILVGMGYTRQSAALGFCFLSLNYLKLEGVQWKFILLNIFAFSFHNTALFFTIVYILIRSKNKLLMTGICLAFLYVLTVTMTSFWDYYYSMISEYIFLADYRASGAIPRGIPIFVASLGFITIARYVDGDAGIYKNISLIAVLIFLILIFVAPYTALDRIYLYFSSLYIAFFSNINIKKYSFDNLIYEIIIFIIFYLYIVAWFTYGKNSSFWLPYDNYLKYIFI